MNIKKSKIYEMWNCNNTKVVKYKQILKNNTLNELKSIETENLNDLIKEVRFQIDKWNELS